METDDPGVALTVGTPCTAPSHEQFMSSVSEGEMSHCERRNEEEGKEKKEREKNKGKKKGWGGGRGLLAAAWLLAIN